ncbi:hypothetical protein VKT23_017498 [Stygiomarasmius scandens]|uniref:Uncharacterized protein n=1 Tax=Marasmiellus scandens TaxID=2682957 RepID=A0ABR1IWC2_9AGAR
MASSSSSSAPAISNATNTIRLERAPIAKISLSTLVHYEQIDRAENVRNACIERENVTCTSGGMSPWKNFYITCSQASGIRHVVWKKGKPYHMDYLFFKTLDTGRLLPMQHAVIRVQFYIDKEKWERQSRNESSDNEDDWKRGNDAEMLHIMMLGLLFTSCYVD